MLYGSACATLAIDQAYICSLLRNVSLCHNIQAASEANPASNKIDTAASFHRGKEAGA